MKEFRDAEGRPWEIRVNVSTLRRVRDLAGIDLITLFTGDMTALQAFIADPYKRADALFVLCQDQAEKRSVSSESFGEALAGDPMEAATLAMLDELASFFPGPKAKLIRAALAKMSEGADLAAKMGMDQIEALDVTAEVRKTLAAKLKN